MSLRAALESKLFEGLQSSDLLKIGHEGGCALFGTDEEVKEYV